MVRMKSEKFWWKMNPSKFILSRLQQLTQGPVHSSVDTSSTVINEQTVGVSLTPNLAKQLNPTRISNGTPSNCNSFSQRNRTCDPCYINSNENSGMVIKSPDCDAILLTGTFDGEKHPAPNSSQINIDCSVSNKRNKSKVQSNQINHQHHHQQQQQQFFQRPNHPSSFPPSSSSSSSSSSAASSPATGHSVHSSQFILRAKSSQLVNESNPRGNSQSEQNAHNFIYQSTSVIPPPPPPPPALLSHHLDRQDQGKNLLLPSSSPSSPSSSSSSSSSSPPCRRMSRFHFPLSPIFLPTEAKDIRTASLASLISSSNHINSNNNNSNNCNSNNVDNGDHDETENSPDENSNIIAASTSSSFSSSDLLLKQNTPSNLFKLCVSRSSIASIESQISNSRLCGQSRNISIVSSAPSRTSSSGSSACCSQCSACNRPKNPKTAYFIVSSSIYGQLLVVICLALFTAKTTTNKIPVIFFEGFYLFLYAVSLVFLFYVYVYLLHDLPPETRNKDASMKRKEKISETEKSHGSIFLRIGAIGFGLGTMIYNGLEFGSFFETPRSSPCYSILIGVNPILQATFTFAQMYFIFTYSRLMINKFKLLARLGLMHLVATNVCTWIRTLGKETVAELNGHGHNVTSSPTIHSSSDEPSCQKEDIMGGILKTVSPYLYPFIVEYSLIGAAFLYVMWCNIGRRQQIAMAEMINANANHTGTNGSTAVTSSNNHHHHHSGNHTSASGNHHHHQHQHVALRDPVVPEAVNNDDGHELPTIGTNRTLPSTSPAGFSIDNLSTSSRSTTLATPNQSLYSCLGSSKGLFSGFLFLVVSITSLIIFFVLIDHPTYHNLATVISELSHSTLLVFCSLATLIAFIKIRKLRFQPGLNETADSGLRDILLKVAAFGLYSYALFGVIAGAMDLNSLRHLAVLVTSALTILQVTLQTLFISDVVCRRRVTTQEPARQLITFLLITNLTLWIIYTFEMQNTKASPVQTETFGKTTWALIVRATLPLSIFYRFHSAITFAEAWKNSYK